MMLSRQILVLGLILVVVKSGAPLYCYGCLASTTSDCFEGTKNSYIVQNCQASATTIYPNYSLLEINNLKHKNGQAPIKTVCVQFTQSDVAPKAFTRGCGYIYENVDICEYLQNITQIEGCSSCEKHLCNDQPGTVDP